MIKNIHFSITSALLLAASSVSFLANAVGKYNITIVETPSEFESSYPVDINNNGESVSNLITRYNYPIDLSLLDFDDKDADLALVLASEFGSAVLSDVERGRFESYSLQVVLSYLQSKNGNLKNQQLGVGFFGSNSIGKIRSGFATDAQTKELAFFDSINIETDEYSYMNSEQVKAINNQSWVAGDASSAFTKTSLDDTVWLEPEFSRRAFVRFKSGKVVPLPPKEDEFFGGRSYANDVSDTGYIVGQASVDYTSDSAKLGLEALQERCEDEQDSIPVPVCLFESSNNATDIELYKMHAFRWKVNANGDIVESLDLGVDLEAPGTSSQAKAVNAQGIAVGDSHSRSIDNRVTTQAVVFNQGAVSPLINKAQPTGSTAVDINDSNVAIGTVVDVLTDGSQVTKSFYIDVVNNAFDVTQLSDFAQNANTKAKAINNANFIVGSAAKDSLSENTQPSIAFLYDIESSQIYDLNELLACATDLGITDAVAINDDGSILAYANRVEERRDVMGNRIRDTKTVIKYTVKLTPATTDYFECAPNLFDKNLVERQGASISMPYLLIFFITFLFKARVFNRK